MWIQTRFTLVSALALTTLLLPACRDDGSQHTFTPEHVEGTPPVEKKGFENPGGMWMPTQMADHAATLKELGLAYDPQALTDPTKFPLGAIVSLGFCSGSFISPEGLIATNHHCGVPVALQYNSTPERNLIEIGYMARERKDELWAGPNQRIFVTTAFKEVTGEVLKGTETIADPTARFDAINANRGKLKSSCESGRSDVTCTIASYFEGAVYYQIEQLQLRDIRLVYAPDAGVGVFGGEIDNWRWPRHTGDFTLLRAYVGKDGKPADYSPDNVPYVPPHHLKMASEPLKAGDLVMVTGYPGRTNRLKTALEAKNAADWYYPYAIARYEQGIELLERLGAADKAIAVKANRQIRGWGNGLTNNKGMLDGLIGGGLAKTKADEEAALKAWIAATPERSAKYGNVLEQIDAADREVYAFQQQDAAANEILGASVLLGRAMQLRNLAAGGAKKPSATELAEFKVRLDSSQRGYDESMDKALLVLALERAAKLPADQQPTTLMNAIVGDARDSAGIKAKVDELYKGTKLGTEANVIARYNALEGVAKGAKDPKAEKDSMLRLAHALNGITAEADARAKKHAGIMAALRPTYVEALRAFKGGMIAPDANSTLRVTYGTVRGYSPGAGKPVYTPFTSVSGMVAKHTGSEPFNAPQNVRDAIAAKKFGPYVAEEIGEVPLDFLADLDITGGNSGSACINRKGEMVGLAFDGNYEAMASDWIFLPEVTRAIMVDVRYMLWMLDAVDGGDHLLKEMGVTPAID